MSFFSEFKEFASKGNVVDLAVGVIIGGAFGKIVTSLVNDVIMPLVGLVVGGVNFSNFAITLKPAVGETPAVLWKIGSFIQATVDFFILAFIIFIMVKSINSLRRKNEEPTPEPSVPAEPVLTREEVLLTEIRDLLKK